MASDQSLEAQFRKLGRRIRELRKQRGFTSHETFAYDNDLPRAQYGRYEKGTDMLYSSLFKVCKALKISLKDFFSEGFD